MIKYTQLDNIFASGSVFTREPNMSFNLSIDSSTLVATAGTLQVGMIDAPNIAPGAITPAAINFDSGDIVHSSPHVTAINVEAALEEVALGYMSRLQLTGGTMAGAINMSGNRITNLGYPTSAADAATRVFVENAIHRGDYYFVPTGYAAPGSANGTLKLTWIRSHGSLYFTSQPAIGDTVDIHGVILVFDTVGGLNKVVIGADLPTTVLNLATEINTNTSLTHDFVPLNTQFFAIREAGARTAAHIVCKSEDPPNTPEDGDSKSLSAISSFISVIGFHGGLNVVKDGLILTDLYSNKLYIYDAMTPSAPWIEITGGGGLPVPHAITHQFGGGDAINVTGLTGLLATPQTPVDHGSTHELGLDDFDLTGLSGVLADRQDADKLQGVDVSSTAPTDGYALIYNGTTTQWEPQSFSITAASAIRVNSLADPVGLTLGDVVYISGSGIVRAADASFMSSMPAVGVVTSTAVGAVDILCSGLVPHFSGLTAGRKYYVSTTAGAITDTPPSTPGEVLQQVGVALNTTTLLLNPQPPTELT